MEITTEQKLETLDGVENGFSYYLSEKRCREAGYHHIDLLKHCTADERGIELVERFGEWVRVDLSYPVGHFHRDIPNDYEARGWTKEYIDFFKSQIGKGK